MTNIYQPPVSSKNIGQRNEITNNYRKKLVTHLSGDLDFHDDDSSYATHNFHSFPAKFPPQLPRKFISNLTVPGDVVLDPMMGSGTTILEAFFSGRYGIGFDIDPLALLLTNTKVTLLNVEEVERIGEEILSEARIAAEKRRGKLENILAKRWDAKTRDFVDYWFAHETQIDLLALIIEIGKIEDLEIRAFFELVFSAIVITKSGGVSLAFDLAHTRPHRAKIVVDRTGEIIIGHEFADDPSPRIEFLTKTLRSPLDEFSKRFKQNLGSLTNSRSDIIQPRISCGDAQKLPLKAESVDLIVTSPPYAANAIDYMRAHKFSLVWLGYSIDDLGKKRKEYIGGDALSEVEFENLPDRTSEIVSSITKVDEKKGQVLHRYYSEMTRTLREMFRVLKPGKAAIIVVGNSVMRGEDTETQMCLANIGEAIGFEVPQIGVRQLDRNRRMMPAGNSLDLRSQIQQRIHEEYVIGFYKP